MSNLTLFPENPPPPKPDSSRIEPVVWIRRLAVWSELSVEAKLIREVPFRRGLNIVRTEERSTNDTRPVGHSVGKTLLLRLIRYCLGEQSFASKAVRQRIADRLPTGYVTAELNLEGQPWIVGRPIGFESNSWAVQSDDFAAIYDPSARQKYGYVVDAIEAATTNHIDHAILQHADRAPRWLDLLAWLARDQECRYARHNEWREPDAESGTAKLAREDAGHLLRAVLDLLSKREQELRVEHARLRSELNALERREERLSAFLEREQAELRDALHIAADIPDGPMLVQKVVEEATEKQNSLERLFEEQSDTSAVERAESAFRTAVERAANTQGEINTYESNRLTESAKLIQAKSDDTNDHYAGFAPAKPWCRFYNEKKDADDAGCPGKQQQRVPGVVDPYLQHRINEITRALNELDEKIQSSQAQLLEQTEARDRTEAEFRHKRSTYEDNRRTLWQRIGHYQSHAERAQKYERTWEEFSDLDPQKKTKQRELDASLEDQAKLREKLTQRKTAISQCYDGALKALLGDQAAGDVEVSTLGIVPRPNAASAPSGAALSTSSVLAFDFACIIASICGHGHHPRFMMHDSPREADMEIAMYHRLLEYAAKLEALFSGQEPSFQYIVTTTTQPPDKLRRRPFVCSTLDARTVEGLLLRQRF